MGAKEKIDIDIFKVVNRAIAESDILDIMATHLAQLLVGALEIKGCAIFALNLETEELEILASFGLSLNYLNKGPILKAKSIRNTIKGESVIINDIASTNLLQYPENAKEEGIRAIISLPIKFYGKVIGSLRLYHHETWDISERDIDSLLLLAENIGLAMTYTRLLNALQAVKDTVSEVHSIWLEPGKA
ncbi:MAG: GAF domain-containing protein [Deltaproteobacteria bacterium]|nr:MAG: GAF domain-containing protein [Deltaproteobacteria bacterium]